MSLKTSLTPTEMIEAAYLHHVGGLTQAQVALAMKVTNHGRVNEAIKKVEAAVGLSDGGYKARTT